MADSTIAKSINEKAASSLNLRTINRKLEEVTKTTGDATDEERLVNTSWTGFGWLAKLFSRNPKVGAAMKTNADVASTLNSPKVQNALAQSVKTPGFQKFATGLQNSPSVNKLSSAVGGKSGQFTTKQVTNVGHLAVASSKSKVATKLWVSFGSAFLLIVGIIVLVIAVVKAKG
ncbi:RxLR effector protein [Phytophthora megakarya]|uniref:RxLR effector protein n=1 Tax=Phytophthora megakarya TaxID=4795 RepID=A0A225WVX7_9STRA|nr:RxLR effector protein [Phytophthora megakarya]